ncbi:MAG: entericidin A/B family lipoprotein [Lautropia sp.]
MKKLTMLILAVCVMAAGCNTMAGFGRDVEKAGDKIEDSATKKK